MQQRGATVEDKRRLAENTPKFRGAWNPSLPSPVVRSFVPVQSAYEIKRKPVQQQKKPVAAAPVPEEKKEVQPPSDAAVNILDRKRDLRSFITSDGTCTDRYGNLIGYINMDSAQCGSPKEEFWGSVDEDGNVYDKDNEKIGEINLGTGYIKDKLGDTICEFDNLGECRGHDGSFIGQFQGFTYRDMKTVALYLLILDPNMYVTWADV